MMDPTHKVRPQIKSILQRIEKKKEDLLVSPRKEKRKISTRMKSLQDFAEIEEKIKLLSLPEIQPSINPEQLIKFDSEAIYKALTRLVTVEGSGLPLQVPSSQKCLIYQTGVVNLTTQEIQNIKPEFAIPKAHASHQQDNKLYICGGRRTKDSKLEFLNTLFVSNAMGKCKALDEMSKGRECLSLTGCENILIALGGFNGKVLKLAQQYSITSDQWGVLPELNSPRQCPGSCILRKNRVFCFCGYKDFGNLNSIQYLDLNGLGSWTQLHVNQKVAKTQQLVALPYQNQIAVFGGTNSLGFSMFLFSEFGELVRDLSSIPNIPGYMCQGIAVEEEGEIYAVGQRREWKEKFRAHIFDGKLWHPL